MYLVMYSRNIFKKSRKMIKLLVWVADHSYENRDVRRLKAHISAHHTDGRE